MFGGIANLGWAYDDENDIDVDYHLRRSALPQPGRVRDLLELSSLLHGSLLDRHRPLWEGHFVEGLNDGRFALYTKFHHALIDGVSALKLMQRALSTDPTTRSCAQSGICLGGVVTRPADRGGRHSRSWRDRLPPLALRRGHWPARRCSNNN